MSLDNIKTEKNKTIIILICFFASGFLGLVYEIIWIRKLGLIFGTTVFSMTTVLSAFFGGLAIGSFLLGKQADKIKNPIKIYALLEFVIGIFALLFPSFIRIYGWFYTIIYEYVHQSFFTSTLIKFILFEFLLIIPTTMMGGTLPIISGYLIRSNQVIGSRSGIIYGINTAGATLGTFLCGFYFIRLLGVDITNYFAGIINIAIALLLYLVSRNAEIPKNNDEFINETKLSLNYIPICFFFSGFASIGYEIAWTRYLSLPLANTRYTYTIILTVFLLGTALGSLIFTRLFDKIKNGVRFFAYLELGIGYSAFLLAPMVYYIAVKVKYLPILYDFIACFILMFVTTLLMGATFPIVVRIMTKDYRSIGNFTGRLYAINTFGCILGSIITGFVFIPFLGIKLSLNVLIAINIVIGFFCLFKSENKNWIFKSSIVFVVLTAFIVAHFTMKVDIPRDFLNILKGKSEEITIIDEGLENTVWVTSNIQNQQKSIWANQTVLGRTKTNEPYSFSPQIIQGHIPMLLHNGSPKRILGICLGTGQTFGSILSYDIEKMDLVEISKTIAKIALEEFKNYNRHLINDKRLNLIIEDGRNYIAHTKNSYDIITLEPSPPEEAGIVNLYTKEFYKLCYRRLNTHGIMSQWLPMYSVSPEEMASIIRTFIEIFPNSLLWYNSADLILLGFKDEIKIDINKIRTLLTEKNIYDDLNISYLEGKDSYLNLQYPLLACLLLGPKELKAFSESYFPITDNHPNLEWTFLKYENLADKSEMMMIYNAEKLKQYLTPLKDFYQLDGSILETMDNMRSRYIARLFAEAYNRIAVNKSDVSEAIELCNKAIEYDPNYSMAYGNLGSYYYSQGDLTKALNNYEKAVSLLPEMPNLWYVLGSVYWELNKPEMAINAWLNAVKLKPNFTEAYNNLGVAYTKLGRYQEAINAYKTAITIKADANVYYNLGLAYEAILDWQNAIFAYKKAIEIDPQFEEADIRLREILRR